MHLITKQENKPVAVERVSVRKWLPSYVTVTRVIKPKKGKGSFKRNNSWRNE